MRAASFLPAPGRSVRRGGLPGPRSGSVSSFHIRLGGTANRTWTPANRTRTATNRSKFLSNLPFADMDLSVHVSNASFSITNARFYPVHVLVSVVHADTESPSRSIRVAFISMRRGERPNQGKFHAGSLLCVHNAYARRRGPDVDGVVDTRKCVVARLRMDQRS